jgi:hypothetical protein
MQELDHFKAQLKTMWSPAVAVIASNEANNLCLETNGLTVAELLRPFGALRRMNGGMGGEYISFQHHPFNSQGWLPKMN